MKRYVLSPEAQEDLHDIRAYYLKNADARVARYVLGEITGAFRLLAARRGAGHTRGDLTTEPMKFWQVFSYLIVYDPAMQPIGIARALHSRRDLESLFRGRPPRVCLRKPPPTVRGLRRVSVTLCGHRLPRLYRAEECTSTAGPFQ